MANRRMISKSISVSDKVNGMSLFAQLLFTWMIPHADDWGRMRAKPAVVKALVVPMHNVTSQDVEAAIGEMESAGLVVRYEADGEMYISFPGWEEHQGNLHKRTASKFPEPPGSSRKFSEVQGNTGAIELNSTKENLTEPNLIPEVADEPNNEPKELTNAQLLDKLMPFQVGGGQRVALERLEATYGKVAVGNALVIALAQQEPVKNPLVFITRVLENGAAKNKGKVAPQALPSDCVLKRWRGVDYWLPKRIIDVMESTGDSSSIQAQIDDYLRRYPEAAVRQ